jgi:hypothetical protein
MPYLELDPTCKALMEDLRETDRQRDHLRAQLADAALHVELKEVDRGLPWGFTLERRAEIKAEREAAVQERIAKRVNRRANEMRLFGSYIRPGTWDADLDNYPEPRYEEPLDDGYTIRLTRARDLTWNGYVILPAGHVASHRHYDFFGHASPTDLPQPPWELTHSATEGERSTFGFYLTGIVKPRDDGDYTAHNFYSVEKTGRSSVVDNGSVHVDYAKMRSFCVELVDYFKSLASNKEQAAICRSAERCEEHRYFFVGACEACAAPPPERSLASRATVPTKKKSWAAVAAAK